MGCQVLRLAITVVLARILSPRDFGLAAMLFAFTGFVRVFTSSGFGPSIAQKQNLRAEHLNTIFWVNVATGLVLALVLSACAPAISRFYDEPILLGMALVVAVTFLLDGLNIVQNALLQKSMNNIAWKCCASFARAMTSLTVSFRRDTALPWPSWGRCGSRRSPRLPSCSRAI